MVTVDEQMAVLMRGVEYGDANIQHTMGEELRERLKLGRPLRVYCGFDPTFTGLTLGNMVVMLKLRQFQRFGHEVTFLLGTMTAQVGDPSDKTATRQMLSAEEVEANTRDWLDQAFRVLDPEKTMVRRNADWLAPLTLTDVVQLASHFTVAEFLAHETFRKRMEESKPLYIHEFIYALMQAYDAHYMKTDVQVGGSDQLFNIMAGRKLQQALGERPLVAVTTPLLIGTDGHLKMSKSVGNSINLDEAPADMYGHLMSINDSLIGNYLRLLTEVPAEEIAAIERGIEARSLNPMDAKKRLAHAVVALLNDEATAGAAQAEFERVFQRREQPQEVIEATFDKEAWLKLEREAFELQSLLTKTRAKRFVELSDEERAAVFPSSAGWSQDELAVTHVVSLPSLLTSMNLARSRSEARRLIEQGAVQIDGNVWSEPVALVKEGSLLRVGRHRFVRMSSLGSQ